MKLLRNLRKKAGYTLAEIAIVAAIFTVVGGTVYVLLTAGLNLFARNHAINQSGDMARTTLDRMTRDMHAAIESPKLIDSTGAEVIVSGTGTVAAAGVKFRMFVAGPVKIPNATSSSSMSVSLVIQSTDVRPVAGQFLVIPASTVNTLPQDVYARISAVTGTALAPTLSLAGALGSNVSPVAMSGTVSPANTVAYIVQEVSYVVTRSPASQVPELRFYKRALSVAKDTSDAFHNSANYVVVTPNMRSTPTPFRRAAGDRALAVQLTAEDDKYSKRLSGSFTKSLSIGTSTKPHTIPYKSLGL